MNDSFREYCDKRFPKLSPELIGISYYDYLPIMIRRHDIPSDVREYIYI